VEPERNDIEDCGPLGASLSGPEAELKLMEPTSIANNKELKSFNVVVNSDPTCAGPSKNGSTGEPRETITVAQNRDHETSANVVDSGIFYVLDSTIANGSMPAKADSPKLGIATETACKASESMGTITQKAYSKPSNSRWSSFSKKWGLRFKPKSSVSVNCNVKWHKLTI
jgi:hypothetical protein